MKDSANSIGISINENLKYDMSFLTQHIFIVGTTGSGKTRAIQKISEELLKNNISIYLSDIKGDLGGIYVNTSRMDILDKEKQAFIFGKKKFPISFQLYRIPVPILSKLFEINQTQEEGLYIIMESVQRKRISRLDELISLIHEKNFDGIDRRTKMVILRKLKVAKIKGYGSLFGKNKIEWNKKLTLGVFDKLRKDPHLISIINTLILNEIFNRFGECGSCLKFVAFFDEAHYLFRDANPSFIKLIETILRQIRSKGVGIVFASQDTGDIPKRILKLFSSRFIFRTNIYSEKDKSDLRLLVGKDYEKVRGLNPGECFYSFPTNDGNSFGLTKWDLPMTKNAQYPKETMKRRIKGFLERLFRR